MGLCTGDDADSVGWCAVCMLRVVSLQCHRILGDLTQRERELAEAQSANAQLEGSVDKVSLGRCRLVFGLLKG